MSSAQFDVLGIGNAIVDVIARTEDDFLVRHAMNKGSMALIDEARAEAIYASMGPAIEASGGKQRGELAIRASIYRSTGKLEAAVKDYETVAAQARETGGSAYGEALSELGFAQMLMRHLKPDGTGDERIVRRALQAVEQQSDRLSRLVSRLLDVARIEGGRLAVEPTETDVIPLVEGVIDTIQASGSHEQFRVRHSGNYGDADDRKQTRPFCHNIDRAFYELLGPASGVRADRCSSSGALGGVPTI